MCIGTEYSSAEAKDVQHRKFSEDLSPSFFVDTGTKNSPSNFPATGTGNIKSSNFVTFLR
jgi:hypothetical protein